MNEVIVLSLLLWFILALVLSWMNVKQTAAWNRIGAHYRREHRIMRRNDRIKEMRA